MMKVIYKFKLKAEDEQQIELPFGSTFVCANKQLTSTTREEIMLWFLCNKDATKVKRKVVVVPTGMDFSDDNLVYLDTVFLSGGLVFHIFIERA
jgi:hypothetical protein